MKRETLIAAVEQNDFAFFISMKASSTITIYDEEKLLYCRSKIPFPFFNCHKRLNCPYAEAAGFIDTAIYFSEHEKLPVRWQTGPSTHPAEVEQMLIEKKFELEDMAPGMAVDLAELPASRGGNFTIEHLTNEDSLADWKYVFQAGFELEEFVADGFIEFHKALGFEKDCPAQHFLARVKDEPAGIATVFLGAGAAGIYNIATLKDFRGRGIGREMTLAAMALGRAKGFRVGVLSATEIGVPLYQKLGFTEVCKIGLYNYFPKQQTT